MAASGIRPGGRGAAPGPAASAARRCSTRGRRCRNRVRSAWARSSLKAGQVLDLVLALFGVYKLRRQDQQIDHQANPHVRIDGKDARNMATFPDVVAQM